MSHKPDLMRTKVLTRPEQRAFPPQRLAWSAVLLVLQAAVAIPMTEPDPVLPRPCPQCEELLRHTARDAAPHSDLKLLHAKPWAETLARPAAGALETYACEACGKERVRDTSPTYSARWM